MNEKNYTIFRGKRQTMLRKDTEKQYDQKNIDNQQNKHSDNKRIN